MKTSAEAETFVFAKTPPDVKNHVLEGQNSSNGWICFHVSSRLEESFKRIKKRQG